MKPNMHRRVGDPCLFLFRCYWLNVYQDPKEMDEKSRIGKGNVGERQIRKKTFMKMSDGTHYSVGNNKTNF